MPQKNYLLILKSGIYLAFLSVFFVFSDFFFPYITSKQIPFNILIEVLLIVWAGFLVKYPEYRPKKSWISIGLISFFAVMFLSAVFGVDFNLSFWGDIERMLGFFHIIHFLAFYFIIITVMRSRKDWRNLMIVSVLASFLVALYSFKVLYSTIGNTAYVSGYLIFNIYFALLLFFSDKNWISRALYTVAIIVMLVSLKNTGTAGAYVGMGVSVISLLLLYGSLNRNKKIKKYILASFVLSVVVVTTVFSYRDRPFVQNNNLLRGITSEVSIGKNTFQTRLISWKTAWLDFPAHPILGTGYGNFAITFDKYFDPKFYTFTSSETYFDRAHNNIIDITSTTGLLGLLTYLSVFAAVGYYLIRGYRKEKISLMEFSLLTALMIAYFIQNLAVFDSLVTYLSLMVALGFIYWLIEVGEDIKEENKPLINKEIYALAIAGVIMFSVIYQFNIKPMKMIKGTIAGQTVFAQGDVIGGIDVYKEALNYNTVLDRDSRDSLIRLVLNNFNALKNMEKEKAREILDFTVELAEKNVKYNPQDSLMQTVLAQILYTAMNLNIDNAADFNYYASRAEEAINKAIETSPGRIPPYFQKAQIFLARGEKDKAIEIFEYAVSLNKDYPDSTCQLAKAQIAYEDKKGYENMDKCIDMGGLSIFTSKNLLGNLINHYLDNKDKVRALKVYEQIAQLEPDNATLWANLANIYADEGEKEKARDAALKAAELDASMRDAAEEFIRKLGL